ncbi:hypothetical protein HPB48_006924 [Haemaphysalis longicornis]|uniref:Uncharacterized protein n=1 Tax=Haemaphysalis longicornis TaxID=44386 RepID=A0A9J6GSW0_HAELO|nr:hypothetical protein HPB48_006924 [Haemaphysalis longicornis]
MSHVLVKWLKTGRARIFDVVSVRDVVDTKVGAAILQNPKDAGVVGAEVSIRWSGEKHPAQIIAVDVRGGHPQLLRNMATGRNGSARVRFHFGDDLALLRQVLLLNAFRDASKWEAVAGVLKEVTGKVFSARSVRDRRDLLLAQYSANDRANLRKSGTEEQYEEKEHLLQELIDLA